ncbi:uncharacterized protein BO95DRAFT_457949 [Aspergillus brunneoviolaceus CBS 621.78]|uniref:Uncharacterized protein n=1 Tax=Aspergillus brunneoviolaceus CBS 621.78 TaxID=1450534 RepID=A0ACD1FRV6_9EURO|nr:hypothetical protein BO95DRAFT_457949 [Aspergillus brunneoviolaceus CBS 621.78]RAH39699.1 hypothetical protein BO95DRAFT_457949 [Aspergillus brunneoviolaceus CBS 621.78]
MHSVHDGRHNPFDTGVKRFSDIEIEAEQDWRKIYDPKPALPQEKPAPHAHEAYADSTHANSNSKRRKQVHTRCNPQTSHRFDSPSGEWLVASKKPGTLDSEHALGSRSIIEPHRNLDSFLVESLIACTEHDH